MVALYRLPIPRCRGIFRRHRRRCGAVAVQIGISRLPAYPLTSSLIAQFTGGCVDKKREAMTANARDRTLSSDPIAIVDSVSRALEDDQTLADSDQTGSDSDQTASDREQAAADSDQAASDRDLVHGGDPDAHGSSREIRSRTAQQRQFSADGRVAAATARDQVAHARDLTALARDQTAELRDREFATQDAASDGRDSEMTLRAAENRSSAAADRATAAESRTRAAVDREQAARDRDGAAREVLQAHAERDALLAQLASAETDGLTGTRSRATGLEDLDHEIARARRTMAPLVIAYIDVVGLKAVNDAHGHGAGDALLRHAASAIRDHLRSYDVIVRIGGDEFMCVMSGATIEYAHQRFAAIQATLAADGYPCEIKVGFAALTDADTATDLIQRADAELPASSRS
jgi:diguanylate cyclase (GGDEF)-like protein